MRYESVIGICWLFFMVWWLVSAVGVKKSTRKRRYWVQGVWFRILFFLAIFSFITEIQKGRSHIVDVIPNPFLNILGVILCICGIAFAIWARVHIGKNWGMPMSLKEKPELVTSGPYRYVRHPIYFGVILAALGSALVSWFWFIFLAFFMVYFIFSAKEEEKIMTGEFPEAYPLYKARTKMLIPFIL